MSAPNHNRIGSSDERRRVATPRRSTVGPLDLDVDNPLAEERSSIARPARTSTPHQVASPLSATQESSTPSALDDLPPKDLSFLLDPSVFHSLPTNSTPQPFLASINASDINDSLPNLLSRGQYRLAALHCARELSAARDPTAVSSILSLFHTRLACLTLLSHHDLAAQESKTLGDITSSFYRHPISGAHIVPWSLRVLCVRLAALGFGEWRKGIMGYYELAREAREALGKTSNGDQMSQWGDRLRELGILTANLLVEMGDLEGAAEHLATLPGYNKDAENFETFSLRSMEAFVWLRVGDVPAAHRCLLSPASSSSTPLNALLKMADDDYEGAITTWKSLQTSKPSDPMFAQNLAVCLLYNGDIAQARQVLEGLIDAGNSFHSLTFNLATLYELSTEHARDRKMQLAERLAALKPSADGGWEKSIVDFKL